MKKTFNVKGMHCKSCEMRINDSLEDLGVNSSTANAGNGLVTVDFDEKKVSEDNIKKAIEKEGYKVLDKPEEKKGWSLFSKKGSLEMKGITYSINVCIILSILFLLSYFGFLKSIPGFLPRYGVWLLYLIITITSIGFCLWQFYSYKAKVSCMTGMMIGMVFGMQAGVMIGAILGATNGFFVGAMAGMLIGVVVGSLTGNCCGIMGMLQGMMAGVMGGTMGPMISLMMLFDHLNIFMPVFMAINVIIMVGLAYMFYKEVVEGNDSVEKAPVDFLVLTSASVIAMFVLSAIMIYGPKSAFVIGG
jgi:copper chaperone CopZ